MPASGPGATLVGAAVEGAAVVGATVVGAIVGADAVVGVAVVGAPVVPGTVVAGAVVVVEEDLLLLQPASPAPTSTTTATFANADLMLIDMWTECAKSGANAMSASAPRTDMK